MANQEIQLQRMEEIQQQIHSALICDSLDELEALIAEKGARLKNMLSEPSMLAGPARGRLSGMLEEDQRLAMLIGQKLEVWRTELRKLSDSARLLDSYAPRLAQQQSGSGALADYTG